MKFSVVLFFVYFALSICDAALIKRYFRGNVQNQFTSQFEPQLPYTFSTGGFSRKEDIGKLTTSLLHDIHIRAGKGFNIVISPVSVWMILAMLLEGADGNTERQLKSKLHIPYSTREQGKQILRTRLKELMDFKVKGPTEFENINFVITDSTKMINPEYKKIISELYKGRHFEVGGGESEEISRMINTWASQATKNRIPALVSPAMLSNLLLVMGNAVYFKSKWKYPFDPSQTVLLPFMDEFEKPIKKVPMMNQVAVLPYAYNWMLESEMIEIPYADGVTSMIVIFPRERVSLSQVLSKMRYLTLDQIIPRNFTEETVQLSMPRFHIESKMYLNEILKQDLGTVFSPREAEFPHIGKNIFVSKVFHKGEIENTEEGTTASAVSSVQFAYKSSSVMFRANRPFIYLISEVRSRTILFAGTYSNPFVS